MSIYIYTDISWFFICTGTTEPMELPRFCLNSGSSGDGACVCPEKWVGSLCHIGQYKPGSMGSWYLFWENLHFGRSWTFPAAEIWSAGSDLRAVPQLFVLGEAVFFTHLKGIIHLGKTLQVLTICDLFLSNLAVDWRSQWPENLIQVSVTSVAVFGFALCLRTPSTSAPCRTMPAFSSCCHWHWSWMSQISYTWNSTVLVDSHFSPLCHSISALPCAGRLPAHWAAGSPELVKSPALFFPRPTTHNVASVTHKYTVMCQLGFCQMMWHVWSEGCQNIYSVPGKYAWWGLLGRWRVQVFHVISLMTGWAAHPTHNDRWNEFMTDWNIWAKCFREVGLNKIIVAGISALETKHYDGSVISFVRCSSILHLICCELP